jgi:hypothetical protein
MSTLERAIAIAAKAHAGKVDKTGESYDDFVRRAILNPIGRRVKLADLEDNSDLTRIANPTEEDYERLAKYERAMQSIRDN